AGEGGAGRRAGRPALSPRRSLGPCGGGRAGAPSRGGQFGPATRRFRAASGGPPAKGSRSTPGCCTCPAAVRDAVLHPQSCRRERLQPPAIHRACPSSGRACAEALLQGASVSQGPRYRSRKPYRLMGGLGSRNRLQRSAALQPGVPGICRNLSRPISRCFTAQSPSRAGSLNLLSASRSISFNTGQALRGQTKPITSRKGELMKVHELFAYLHVKDAAKAIDFYKRAFGVKEKFRLTEPSGRIGHAELDFGGPT